MVGLLHYFGNYCIFSEGCPLFFILLYVVGTERQKKILLQERLLRHFTVASEDHLVQPFGSLSIMSSCILKTSSWVYSTMSLGNLFQGFFVITVKNVFLILR